MLVAKQKRKENIAEYILYLWQVEDLIRANNLEIERIENLIINQYNQPSGIKKEIKAWYENLIEMMRLEKKEKSGHVQAVTNLITDLTSLHLNLLKSPLHPDYQNIYNETIPVIAEFYQKSTKDTTSEIELCLNALYGFLLLRIQKKEITDGTIAAMQKISKLIALLAQKYKLDEADELEL